MSGTKHTPTPWVVSGDGDEIASADGMVAITVSRREVWRQNAAFIVRACNSHDALLAAAKAALEVIESLAEDEGYGAFHGGDPRDFDPDPECSTEEERAAWRRDCEAMAAGGQALMPPAHAWETLAADVKDRDGEVVVKAGAFVHVARAGYGLGTYKIRDEEMCRRRDALRAAIERAEKP